MLPKIQEIDAKLPYPTPPPLSPPKTTLPLLVVKTDFVKSLPRQITLPNGTDDSSPSPTYSPIDYPMSDVDSSDEDLDDGELIDIDDEDTDEDSELDEAAWKKLGDEWSSRWTKTTDRQVSIRSDQEAVKKELQVKLLLARKLAGTQLYQKLPSSEPGIFGYGPFKYPEDIEESVPSKRDYRIFVHPTDQCDVLDFFAYGGEGFKHGTEVNLYKLPVSQFVMDSRLFLCREQGNLLHQVEAYLRQDKRYEHGVKIPNSFLVGGTLVSNAHDGAIHYRFPLVEKFLATFAARSCSPRLAHPFGPLQLEHISHLVSPGFPARNDRPFHLLYPPDLPYIRVDFDPSELRHADDKHDNFLYYGCLPRYNAFLFQKWFPTYIHHLQASAIATYQFLALHASPKYRPPVDPKARVNWEELLEPKTFRAVFPYDKPSHVIARVSPNPESPNVWLQRLPYLLLCARQVTQLIQLFEKFFQIIGYDGLREVVRKVRLNDEISWTYNVFLHIEETEYLTALYDFLLREHAIDLSQTILRLLHISFDSPFQLSMCRTNILDEIEEPMYSFALNSCI